MTQPKWLAHAWAHLGEHERPGARHNPRILKLFADAGHPKVRRDEVAWCAAFVCACLEQAGCTSTRSLMARSFLDWGEPLAEGRFGAIAIFSRGKKPAHGHVGFYVGETDSRLYVLSGNQSNSVSVTAIPKSRLLGFRWPKTATNVHQQGEGGETAFKRALAHVLKMEGGFTNDPVDPGGPTNKGITLAVYAGWRDQKLNASTRASLLAGLKALTDEEAGEIYHRRYWLPARCDALKSGLALMHFDAAVNHGVGTAIRILQRAVGTDVDGEIGPNTRAAIDNQSEETTVQKYAQARRRRYQALSHFWRFGRGWLSRVDKTLELALLLIRSGNRGDAAGAGWHEKPGESAKQTLPQQTAAKGPSAMGDKASSKTHDTIAANRTDGKWWGESMTIWGTLITAAATVLPALAPLLGVELTAELVHRLGADIVKVTQALAGLAGTLMAIYGRTRAAAPLQRKSMNVRL